MQIVIIVVCVLIAYQIFKIFFFGRIIKNRKNITTNKENYTPLISDKQLEVNAEGNDNQSYNSNVNNKTKISNTTVYVSTEQRDKFATGYEKAMEYYKNSPNPKFHRTDREKELSFQFLTNNTNKINDCETKIYDTVANTHIGTIEQQIKSCEKAIDIYNRFKNYCYKTKGGTIYFQDMWEYCHNSKNSCFSFIEDTEKHLEFLNKYHDTLKNLDSIIVDTIKNNSGILQKDIYKLIDIDLKSIIQSHIRDLEAADKITRTKKSGSYLLEISQGKSKNNDLPNTSEVLPQENLKPEVTKPLITLDASKSTQLTAGLNIPDEVVNLLWIKGGPLENYTSEMNETNFTYGISFTATNIKEPSLIDMSLVLDTEITDSDYMTDIGYYPSYEKLTPKQRYVYLSWLQDISRPVAMGYVFIFYYGLERHLMFGKYKEAIKMINYLQQFHKNGSFYTYSIDAILISILKHNDLNLLKSIKLNNASNSIYALVKGALSKGYTAEDLTRLYKVFGFTNNRYIKNQYSDFVSAVRDILVEKFSSDYYPLPVDTIDNCSKQQLLIVANYSLMHKDRFATAPDISSNKTVYDDIHNILITAHETVKANNRKKK